jgi:uncharacterized protein (DUF4415 family)
MKKDKLADLPAAVRAEIEALAALRESAIDTVDIPEVLDWSGAKHGVFYRPLKQQLTLRLDADVIDWFRRSGSGYQSRINSALRDFVKEQARKSA